MTPETTPKNKILLLDDDPAVLDLYQQMLLQLPSQPDVHIASSGARAMTMLDAEPFNVLVCDLHMPKMDGLQVISIVRRKYPQLKTVIITGLKDERMRARAYALGTDLYVEKPMNQQEFDFLLDCVESLLDQEQSTGFRGVQSKTLVDLIQLECLSGSSSVLKITNGKIDARIWIQNGEVIDAESEQTRGEEAFRMILSWRTGNFEILPPEPDRPRGILAPWQALLLDTAQALDEADADRANAGEAGGDSVLRRERLGRVQGLEFALKLPHDPDAPVEKWGIENPQAVAVWARRTLNAFQELADKRQFGAVQQIDARGVQGHTRLSQQANATIVLGMLPGLSREQVNQTTNQVLERWAS